MQNNLEKVKEKSSLSEVVLIFRKKNPNFFSIENVFSAIVPYLKQKFMIREEILPYYSSSLVNITRNILSIKKTKFDIFHVTGDVHYAVFLLPRSRTILTIHDTVFMDSSRGVKRFVFKWLFLKIPVFRCGVITTISGKSKNEIIRYTGCDPNKIVVIADPVDKHFHFKKKLFNCKSPIFLFIGSTSNKNLHRVIDALTGIECEFHIVGAVADKWLTIMNDNKIRFRHFEHLSNEQMAERYEGCDVVLFPSLYEGFGLPIIEGQKAGRVVVTSDIEPMNVVAGGGACLVNPYDVESIRAGILRVISDSEYREEKIALGLINVRNFEPEVIANEYISLYKKCLPDARN